MWEEFKKDCCDDGVLWAIFYRFVMLLLMAATVLTSPIWLPIALLNWFNEWSMTWFEDKEKEP